MPQILTCSNEEIMLSLSTSVYFSYWAFFFLFSICYIESLKCGICIKLRTMYLADNALGHLLESI